MDARALTDFSIERLLSPEVGLKPQVVRDTSPEWAPGPDPVAPAAPAPVPVCLQYRGFTDRFCPCAVALHHPNFPGFYAALFQNFVQNRAEPPQHSQAPPQPRQKARTRTAFTHAQSRQLEALFRVTDYPTAEARAELSARAGLSEETVRVWFKNRRARRKRQRGDPKVPPPVRPAGDEISSPEPRGSSCRNALIKAEFCSAAELGLFCLNVRLWDESDPEG